VELTRVRRPAAFRDHRAGAVGPLRLVAARLDRDALLGPDRFTGVRLAHRRPLLDHGAAAGFLDTLDVLLVAGLVSHRLVRHLVLGPAGLHDGVVLLADVLLVDRPVGAPVLRHLVLGPARPADRVALLPDVLLIDRPLRTPADRHLVLGPAGLHDGVLLLA